MRQTFRGGRSKGGAPGVQPCGGEPVAPRPQQHRAAALCRSGGEEFLLLLPGVSLSQAATIAERLRTRVAGHEMETAGHITLSLGVAHWGAQSGDLAAVLKQADKALYEAKHRGRNCVVAADA